MKTMTSMMGLVGVMAIALSSCQKDPLKNLTASESRIYITNHDSTVNFSTFRTFSIADSVLVIEDNERQGADVSTFDVAVIRALREAMTARGFEEVSRSDSPDLGINVSRVYNNYTGLVSYPAYWGNYGSFYDPYYWGYGGYSYYDPIYYGPTYYSTYQVTQGALSVDILNLRDARVNNSIYPVWSALARGSQVFNDANVQAQIAAFFDQSPYLSTNQ